MAKHSLHPLFAAEDEPIVRPILETLKEKGFSIGGGKAPKKNDTVLFFLSKNLAEDSPVIDEFLRLDAQKLHIIPVNLDGATPPALIGNAMLARNTIFASRYSTQELSERIAEALKRHVAIASKMRKGIIAAAVLALLAVIGVVLWRVTDTGNKQETVVESTPAPSAAPTAVPLDLPDDIPPEDVNRILEIAFVGDTYRWYTPNDGNYGDMNFTNNYNAFAYRYWDEDGAHWLSKEDGHEFPLTHYDDLSWLVSLPNLRCITFCAVDAEIPNLAGLSKLTRLYYCDNQIGTLDWLRGSNLRQIDEFHSSDIKDFSPLTDCAKLKDAGFDLVSANEVDFSGFCPPALERFWISNAQDVEGPIDLSGLDRCPYLVSVKIADLRLSNGFTLENCSRLNELELRNIPNLDLSFLLNCSSVKTLTISDLSLRSLDGIQNLKKLQELKLESVEIHDISAVAGCTALETFNMGGYRYNEDIRDLSVLGTLPKLRSISTHTTNISNLNFLRDLKIKEGISLQFSSSSLTDFSALAEIKSFGYVHFNLNGRDFTSLLLPYVQNATFGYLDLYDCSNVDLSMLPKVNGTLSIQYGDLTSLEGLDQSFTNLILSCCRYLTSIEGIQGLSRFGNGQGDLIVEDCPRLTDWSALNGRRLMRMEFRGIFTLPDFSQTSARYMQFDQVDEEVMPDLSCLEGLDRTQSYDFDFSGQQNLPDLIPLFKLHGDRLVVPPQLGEQAQELVNDTRFHSFEIKYPDGNWQPNNDPFTLLSLDELETLPRSVLSKVDTFNIAGDFIFDQREYWIEEDWSTTPITSYLRKQGSNEDERVLIETGTLLTDLSVLKKLTGLKYMRLYMQPLETLDGIQYLESLEDLCIQDCGSLTDVSAAFTLQALKNLNLRNTGVTSIQGVENLYNLEELRLDGTDIADLSPLAGLNENVRVNGINMSPMTFEKFCALPQCVLNTLERIEFAGNYVFDPDSCWIEENRRGSAVTYYLHDNWTNTRIPLEQGPMKDLSALPVMQRLYRLRINIQPLVSFDGIERQPNLQQFEMRRCYEITDISPLYEQENLSGICFAYSNVDSIEGVQRMKRLTELNLSPSKITDLSPLAKIDYSYCMQPDESGLSPYFSLQVDNMQGQLSLEQYEYLACVPYYDYLNICGTDWKFWMEALKYTPIRGINVANCNWDNDSFRSFIEQHPELEWIDIKGNQRLTDISPLLMHPNVSEVRISRDMQAAIRSLGDSYGFRLQIND